MAVPRGVLPDGAEVALPEPLGPNTAAKVREIFALQEKGKIAEAARLTDGLADRTLVGAILAERYLGPYTNTRPSELEDWLKRFGNQAPAPAIYALLERKLPRGAARPPAPRVASLPSLPVASGPAWSIEDAVAAETKRVNGTAALVGARATAGEISSALAIARHARVSPAERAALEAIVARALFADNRDTQAETLAAQAFADARGADGASAYVAGLAAWRRSRTNAAYGFFVAAADAADAEPALKAAGAFWAARASLYLREPKQWLPWIERAAAERGTFYGELAGRILGIGADPFGGSPTLGEVDVDALAATPAGWRAFALLEVGKPGLAAAEFATLWPTMRADPAFARSVALVAAHTHLAGLAAHISESLASLAGGAAPLPAEPLPELAPSGGFSVSPALVYGIARVESNFDPRAVSSDGAVGLMQLMPETARLVSEGQPGRLGNPATNLALGQRYLHRLAGEFGPHADLLHVLGSYNRGPNGFREWARHIKDHGDPLLFIEAIPNDQTRNFVEAVLTYAWMYAMRLNLPSPSLTALAEGVFPPFPSSTNTGRIEEAGLTLGR